MRGRFLRMLCLGVGAASVGGCYNHITGSPPTPPWYHWTKEGRDAADRRARVPTTPEEIWNAARVAAITRSNECGNLAATHPHAEDRPAMFRACDAERRDAMRAADEAFLRSDPEGWRAQVSQFPALADELRRP